MDSIYLVWGRQVDMADDLDDALSKAWVRTEYSDDDWFDTIEVVAADGTSERMDCKHPVVAAAFDRCSAEADKRHRESLASRLFLGNIRVDECTLESLYGDADPEARLAELRPYLGNRVTFQVNKVSR